MNIQVNPCYWNKSLTQRNISNIWKETSIQHKMFSKNSSITDKHHVLHKSAYIYSFIIIWCPMQCVLVSQSKTWPVIHDTNQSVCYMCIIMISTCHIYPTSHTLHVHDLHNEETVIGISFPSVALNSLIPCNCTISVSDTCIYIYSSWCFLAFIH